jgi:hypothetical protein
MMNAFGRAIGALGVGIIAVGHWFWTYHPYLPRARAWEMNRPLELYTGVFLIGVGVHAIAFWYWFNHVSRPGPAAPSSVQEPK